MHSALLICLGYVFIPCRDVHGILWYVCMRESETVFPTLTDLFKNPLIHISVSLPVMVIILLQTCRLACFPFPFPWLQETVLLSEMCTSCSSHPGCRSCHVPPGLASSLPCMCQGKLLHFCTCQTQAQLHGEHYWPCAMTS